MSSSCPNIILNNLTNLRPEVQTQCRVGLTRHLSASLLSSRTPSFVGENLLEAFHFKVCSSLSPITRDDAAAAAAAVKNPRVGPAVLLPSLEDAIEVPVDGYAFKIPKGFTVLQACEAAGVGVPPVSASIAVSLRPATGVFASPRVEKSPKASFFFCHACTSWVRIIGMKIKTDTPLAKKAREGVMEFLLMNHPLDCPICD